MEKLISKFAVTTLFIFALNPSLSVAESPFSEQQRASVLSFKTMIIADVAHGDRYMLEHELATLEKIKNADPSYNCLFLEIEPKAEDAIRGFLNGEDYVETVGLWISESSRKTKFPFVNIIPDWYLLKVHQMGYQIRGADVDWSSDLGAKIIPLIKKMKDPSVDFSEYAPLLVGERSRLMANRIADSLVNKSCLKSVLVVGEGHLEPIGFGYKSVQQYLKDAGITGGILY